MSTAKIDDTLEMYYDNDDFTDPWTTAETVVMHHGMGKNGRLWYAWVPLLANRYRVVRLDARGLGRSTVPPPGYSWSLSGFGQDLNGLLDHLGLDKVHLIGETVGGTVAMRFAYDHPERLKSLTVCTSPFKFVGNPMYLEHRDLVDKEGVEAWVRQSSAQRLDPAEADPGHQEWYIQQMCATAPRVVSEALTYLGTQDLSDILPKIQVPTLIIVGEKSTFRHAVQAEEMQKLVPGSRLAIVPGGTGFIQHSQPEKCAKLWLEFAAGLG